MKKIVYTLAFAVLSFASCERSLDDTFDELGTPVDDFAVSQNEYTLVDEDYESLKVDGEFFNSIDDARSLLPAFLDDKYPNLDDGSLTLVNFNVTNGDVVDAFDLKSSDYDGLRTDDFVNENPDNSPVTGFEATLSQNDITDYLEELLVENTSNPQDGDVYQVNYNSIQQDTFYNVDFTNEEIFNSYEIISLVGEQLWNYSEDFGARISGFSGTDMANEDWFISPEIDLSSATDVDINITQVLNFLDGDNNNQVLVSSDYSEGNDFTTATWEEIEFVTIPDGTDWDPVQSERVSLNAYAGQTINLAFVYNYPDGDTPTWQITNIVIQPSGSSVSGGASSNDDEVYVYESNSEFFEYSEVQASWINVEVVELLEEDYDAMGESASRPGDDNYFTTLFPPEDFLPAFLNLEYPFAINDDKVYVMYQLNGDEAEDAVVDLYTLAEGVWMPYAEIESTSIQFGKRDGVWEPDNTIEYTLVSPDDYDFIGGELLTTEGFEAAADNLAFFHSFESRETDEEFWSTEMLEVGFGVLLNNLDPNAEIGQKYKLSYIIWVGALSPDSIDMIKNEDGEWKINEDL